MSKELDDRLLDIEAKLLEQEHRPIQVIGNFFNRNKWEKDDPRRSSVKKAIIWRLFFSPGVMAVAGGGIGILTLVALLWQNTLFKEQNQLIKTQNQSLIEQLSFDTRAHYEDKLLLNNASDKTIALSRYVQSLRDLSPKDPPVISGFGSLDAKDFIVEKVILRKSRFKQIATSEIGSSLLEEVSIADLSGSVIKDSRLVKSYVAGDGKRPIQRNRFISCELDTFNISDFTYSGTSSNPPTPKGILQLDLKNCTIGLTAIYSTNRIEQLRVEDSKIRFLGVYSDVLKDIEFRNLVPLDENGTGFIFCPNCTSQNTIQDGLTNIIVIKTRSELDTHKDKIAALGGSIENFKSKF